MISFYHRVLCTIVFSVLAVAQNTTSTTYNTTISWYGTNDARGSPNCNSNKAACGFYTYVFFLPPPPPIGTTPSPSLSMSLRWRGC